MAGINFTPLYQAIDRAFSRLVEEFEGLQIDQLTDEKWQWYRQTLRRNGTLVGSPRDIIDTGTLRDSLAIETMSEQSVKYKYEADYSGLVHQGFTRTGEDGKQINYPSRPWVSAAHEENDLLEIFENLLKEELNNA